MKELTPELLSLIVDEEVAEITFEDLYVACAEIDIKGVNYTALNECGKRTSLRVIPQDTLTRLMKEWCLMQGYCILSAPHSEEYGYAGLITTPILHSSSFWYGEIKELCEPTDFKLAITAVLLVAKEKGLL